MGVLMDMVRLYNKGLTAQEVADAFCIDARKVSRTMQAMKRSGVYIKPHQNRFTVDPTIERKAERCAKAYRGGARVEDLAAAYGVHVNTVHRWIKRVKNGC